MLSLITVVLELLSVVNGQCGSGSPNAVVTGSSGSYRAMHGSQQVYSGSNYFSAIESAVGAIGSGQRVAVMASGSIGANTITVGSGKIFEGCGTINVAARRGHGSIESTHTTNAEIRYLKMTGSPDFGMLFYGTQGLKLGQIDMDLDSGMGIRFHRDEDWNYDVSMETINVRGASSHAVETWNIDGLTVGSVIARDVGECGLLLQRVTNAQVGLVDGDNVAAGTGYATFRMANQNGMLSNGQYTPNIFVDKVVSRSGGRGVFCVSRSGGAVIQNVDLSGNGNNAILIENCYGVEIQSGTINGGGEVRVAARDEFPNTHDITVNVEVRNTSVRESPCGTNIQWYLGGSPSTDVCSTVRPYNSSGGSSVGSSGGSGGGGSGGSSGGSSGGCAPRYGQCGGQGWTGATCCASGSTCQRSGQYYSQCL